MSRSRRAAAPDARQEEAAPLESGGLTVSVDNGHCHFYGICEQQAPEVFGLGADGRLHYRAKPEAAARTQVLSAARLCPMQAIELQERKPR